MDHRCDTLFVLALSCLLLLGSGLAFLSGRPPLAGECDVRDLCTARDAFVDGLASTSSVAAAAAMATFVLAVAAIRRARATLGAAAR